MAASIWSSPSAPRNSTVAATAVAALGAAQEPNAGFFLGNTLLNDDNGRRSQYLRKLKIASKQAMLRRGRTPVGVGAKFVVAQFSSLTSPIVVTVGDTPALADTAFGVFMGAAKQPERIIQQCVNFAKKS